MNKKMIFPIVLCFIAVGLVVFVAVKRSRTTDVKESVLRMAKAIEERVVEDEKPKGVVEKRAAEPVTSKPKLPPTEPRPEVNSDSSRIPRTLTVVMGKGAKKNYFVRIREVQQLGRNLSDDEIKALYSLLNRKKGEDNLPFSELNAIKDLVANLLEKQNVKPVDYANNLMAMYYDQEHDVVWRDYCVQHLGHFFRKIDDETEKQKVRELFWEATKEVKLTIAGTALIAMSHNTDDQRIEKNDLASRALELSESPKCGGLTKITALQICAKLNEQKVLPTARSIAISGGSVPLRMSAIAAVGTLGDESDRSMLDKYASSSGVRLRTAAKSALKRLGQKRN